MRKLVYFLMVGLVFTPLQATVVAAQDTAPLNDLKPDAASHEDEGRDVFQRALRECADQSGTNLGHRLQVQSERLGNIVVDIAGLTRPHYLYQI